MADLLSSLKDELLAVEADATCLRSEIAKFVERLSAADNKLAALQALIALYDAPPSLPVPTLFPEQVAHSESPDEEQAEKTETRLDSGASKVKNVINAVRLHLFCHGKTHRSELLRMLIENKIMGSEKNPLGNLAAYLSDHKELFEPDGKGNFSLRQISPKPQPAAETAGSAEAANPDRTGARL